ncbi:PREDICTED: dehydrogenase/reductase SDR family member 7 [Ceratosolen solmsi marchali]|uniref:Dehydrogenase/reductase SDR family member 7 n=1 Tax=Ceratosolen solmsi marchali TaxID=326594 RepID=A0AAJ6VIM5_9HYME|nr:PREDICTED: dehydrogenase/reductase SDR family member 7 [Ceratosolen solmsi marchali]
MVILMIIGTCLLLYHLVYVLFVRFLDCDIKLFFYDKFGKSADTLSGKVVWITGASSGIGEHLAYNLAKAGCKLILSARRVVELHKVKSNCLLANPKLQDHDIHVLVFDVRLVESHERIFDNVISIFGRLDILVNNAGRSQRANWEKIHIGVDKEVFELNTFAVISLSRLAIKQFKRQGSGHIAVTSSLAGIFGVPFSASYTGSKHAIHGYFDSLRLEKMSENIAVTIVCPGPIQTDFLAESFTENIGEKYGIQTEIASNKLSPARCGKLFASALANRLDEVWISKANPLQLTYFVKYYPNISSLFMPYIGTAIFQRMRDSKITMQVQQ